MSVEVLCMQHLEWSSGESREVVREIFGSPSSSNFHARSFSSCLGLITSNPNVSTATSTSLGRWRSLSYTIRCPIFRKHVVLRPKATPTLIRREDRGSGDRDRDGV